MVRLSRPSNFPLSIGRKLLVGMTLSFLAGCQSPLGGGTKPLPPVSASPIIAFVLEDISPHQTLFVEVDQGVQLEVLDWGGEGDAMVLLTGLGDNAHIYDDFANQFTDRFHVFAITRRGFGRSSRPEDGYDVATRALDDIRVLDELKIEKAIFVGHSFAGDELSEVGADFPERVDKLVYLDALDYGAYAKLEQPPMPAYGAEDVRSVARFTALKARFLGTRPPLSSLRDQYLFGESGNVIGLTTPPQIFQKLMDASQAAEYGRIRVPVLAIFAPLSRQIPQPFYEFLTAEQQAEYERTFPLIIDWQADAIERLRQGVTKAQVLDLPGANHYIFISDEAFVVSAMRNFLQPQLETAVPADEVDPSQ